MVRTDCLPDSQAIISFRQPVERVVDSGKSISEAAERSWSRQLQAEPTPQANVFHAASELWPVQLRRIFDSEQLLSLHAAQVGCCCFVFRTVEHRFRCPLFNDLAGSVL